LHLLLETANYESQVNIDKNKKDQKDFSKRIIKFALENLAKHGNRDQMQLVIPYIFKGLRSQKGGEQGSAVNYLSLLNSPSPDLIAVMKQYMNPNRDESLDNYGDRE